MLYLRYEQEYALKRRQCTILYLNTEQTELQNVLNLIYYPPESKEIPRNMGNPTILPRERATINSTGHDRGD